MLKNIFVGWMVLILVAGCNSKSGTTNSENDRRKERVESFKRAFSDGSYNFQIEYNNRLDSSYLDILYQGNKVSRERFWGSIKSDFLTDLNEDKKKEILLVVETENSTDLYGYVIKDGKADRILKENGLNESEVKSVEYKVERNQLIEQFKTLMDNGNDGFHESRYNLVKRDEEYVLLPQGWQPFEIENLIGQYEIGIDKTTGNNKILLIGEREGGKWNVEIRVRRAKDKKLVCQFKSLGEFVDQDLFVPMNQVDPELKGTLQIRFLNSMAAVYTAKEANYKELASVCTGVGSIAGNFKKIRLDE